MELRELAEYAERKYHIRESFKWDRFSGFSVLEDPAGGKWAALLMRIRKKDGTVLELADIKCGQQDLSADVPFIGLPFRMKGHKWVGVTFGPGTDPEAVFALLDRALAGGTRRGAVIVLEGENSEGAGDTPLPGRETPLPGRRQSTYGSAGAGTDPFVRTKERITAGELAAGSFEVPAEILRMRQLDRYMNGTPGEKARIFVRQARLMEDYAPEGEGPGRGRSRSAYPTYHDLNNRQLLAYFCWRTKLRRGCAEEAPDTFVRVLLFELLNGIGTKGPEDALAKIDALAERFQGLPEEEALSESIRQWKFDFAVVNGLGREFILSLQDPEKRERDLALSCLREPEEHKDAEILSALCTLGKLPASSPAFSGDAGARVFANVWRRLFRLYRTGSGKTLFAACFGEERIYPWYPLSNAVWVPETAIPDHEYVLNPVRSYLCRSGEWIEKRFESLYFDRDLLAAVLHGTDCTVRRAWKTGRYLKEKADEAWVVPHVQAVLAGEKRRQEEAERPKVEIDFSSLERIRQDALVTRDSLLTEEELGELSGEEKRENPAVNTGTQELEAPEQAPASAAQAMQEPAENGTLSDFCPLEGWQKEVLRLLLAGNAAEAVLQENHLLPSVAADAVNEACYGFVGDSVVDCDGSRLSLVEDYREDVREILGG